jgi:hypothetical protein
MKKALILTMLLLTGVVTAYAQKFAEIKFETTVHDFGKFSEAAPKVACEFRFTNVGNSPLVINQAIASCGCTIPEYTKEPIAPGRTGIIKVTYNGTGKYPGPFSKSITIRSNAKTELVRIYIKGDMQERGK